MDIPDTYPFQY